MKIALSLLAAVSVVLGRVVCGEYGSRNSSTLHLTTELPRKSRKPNLAARALIFDPNDIANDATWATYMQKGHYYQCLMESTDKLAGKSLGDARTPPSAASMWQGDLVNELATWGWNDGEYSNAVHCDFRDDPRILNKNKVQSAFDTMGLSPVPAPMGPNACFSVEHSVEKPPDDEDDEDDESVESVPVVEQHYTVGGRRYTQTGGHYRFGTNRGGGAIFAQFLKKPSSAAAQYWGGTPTPQELPLLHRASDILWAYWVRDNPDPTELQYYLVNHVQNIETLPLLARVLRENNRQQLPYWSNRIVLTSDQDAFNAILGSPMGSTIAHILIQHKAVLDIKHVMQIHIFRDNRQPGSDPQVQILYWLGDVDEEEVNRDDDEEMRDAPDASKRGLLFGEDETGRKNVVRVHYI